jgi:hypothetical protein
LLDTKEPEYGSNEIDKKKIASAEETDAEMVCQGHAKKQCT